MPRILSSASSRCLTTLLETYSCQAGFSLLFLFSRFMGFAHIRCASCNFSNGRRMFAREIKVACLMTAELRRSHAFAHILTWRSARSYAIARIHKRQRVPDGLRALDFRWALTNPIISLETMCDNGRHTYMYLCVRFIYKCCIQVGTATRSRARGNKRQVSP